MAEKDDNKTKQQSSQTPSNKSLKKDDKKDDKNTKTIKEKEKVEISFDKYIDNPAGKGSAVVVNRKMYKEMYQHKFDAILVREQGVVKYTVYNTNDNNDSYYIHILIPSEVIPKFYYDVVIQLYTSDPLKKANANLRHYGVRFFSNDPAFSYSFAHAFATHDLFIEDLKPKMLNQSLKHVASVRNPDDNVWYVKSLFFAYLTMEKYGLFNRVALNLQAKKYDKRNLLMKIMKASDKIRLRQEAQEKIDKKVAKEKKRLDDVRRQSHPVAQTHKTAIAKTPTVSRVSKTSKVSKTTKKI